ncbi:cyclase family protein [Myxococcota bacterium]|nr:cyclase family protein [Myxococcota bacterium]
MRTFITLLSLLAWVGLPGSGQSEDWFPSRYGPEDSLGALNLLSAKNVVAASRLVKTGKTYALGVITGRASPAFGARAFNLVVFPGGDGSGVGLGTNRTTFNDDYLSSHLGIGTQIDGLGHLGIDHRYYNGTHQSEFFRPDGVTRFGTHDIPPIVTRGVLLDMAGLLGVDVLAPGTALNRTEIDAAAKRQDIEIRQGDVVLVHTGWQSLATKEPSKFIAAEPGLGMEGASYLADRGVVAVGADTWAVEVLPPENPREAFPVHQVLLAKHGVYILENIDTAELAADAAYEFMFVASAPRFEGAVQMVVNPVAIR